MISDLIGVTRARSVARAGVAECCLAWRGFCRFPLGVAGDRVWACAYGRLSSWLPCGVEVCWLAPWLGRRAGAFYAPCWLDAWTPALCPTCYLPVGCAPLDGCS